MNQYANIPSDVLKFLLEDKDIVIATNVFKKKETVDEIRDIASETLFKTIKPYYAQLNTEVNVGVFNFLVEPLKNANFYGSNGIDAIIFNTYLSKNGLVASYNDGGSYFKRVDVKEAWEKRIRHEERHPKINDEIGFGVGTGFIYSIADYIFVDADNGALYTGLSIKHRAFSHNNHSNLSTSTNS